MILGIFKNFIKYNYSILIINLRSFYLLEVQVRYHFRMIEARGNGEVVYKTRLAAI